MISKARIWHQSLSRDFGSWTGRCGRLYSCPMWADKHAYTEAYLRAKGIIRAYATTTGAYDDWGVLWPSSRGHHSSIVQDATRIITSSGSCLHQRAIVATLPAKIAERPLTDARELRTQIFSPRETRQAAARIRRRLKGLGWLLRIIHKHACKISAQRCSPDLPSDQWVGEPIGAQAPRRMTA